MDARYVLKWVIAKAEHQFFNRHRCWSAEGSCPPPSWFFALKGPDMKGACAKPGFFFGKFQENWISLKIGGPQTSIGGSEPPQGHYIRFDFMASRPEILERWWAPLAQHQVG